MKAWAFARSRLPPMSWYVETAKKVTSKLSHLDPPVRWLKGPALQRIRKRSSTIHGMLIISLLLTVPFSLAMLITLSRKADHPCPVCQQPPSPIGCTVRLPSVCMNESCRYAYIRHLQREDMYPIPAIRHILWRNESVSEYFAVQLRTWQRIHPDWTVVLWRDQDLEPFVSIHFPDLLAKFKTLKDHIMRVDMIRYMILYKHGGTYADLDYSLVRSLDSFRRFHAIITREPEAHSLAVLGMAWPARLLASPAFMMSAPGHYFHYHAMRQLAFREIRGVIEYAGPLGLSEIIEGYSSQFPIARQALETIYIPPSHSFYPYPGNNLNSSQSEYKYLRYETLAKFCNITMHRSEQEWQRLRQQYQLRKYCTDVNNMDPITDKFQPVFAIHDLMKSGAAYHEKGVGNNFYNKRLIDIRRIVKQVKFGVDFMGM